jgi:hypothetical protein
MWGKIDGTTDPGYHVSHISVNAPWEARPALFLCRLACFIPGSVYNAAREAYRAVKYGWLRRPLPPTYHVPVVRDSLRR